MKVTKVATECPASTSAGSEDQPDDHLGDTERRDGDVRADERQGLRDQPTHGG